jgi:hypothetical protein
MNRAPAYRPGLEGAPSVWVLRKSTGLTSWLSAGQAHRYRCETLAPYEPTPLRVVSSACSANDRLAAGRHYTLFRPRMQNKALTSGEAGLWKPKCLPARREPATAPAWAPAFRRLHEGMRGGGDGLIGNLSMRNRASTHSARGSSRLWQDPAGSAARN